MTERAKKLLLLYYKQSRKIRRVSGLPPLTFKAKKAGTLNNYRIYGNTETLTRSYSGAAPLSFPITGGAVSNYRIYGNTENGESVGELVTDSQSEHYGKYAIPIINNSETANIYLNEPLRKVENNADYIDYATQKWHRGRKNLFNINNLEDGYDISLETGLPTRGSAYSYIRCAITTPINVSAGDYYLTFNKNIENEIGFIVSVFENNTFISRTSGYHSGDRIQISSGNNIYIGFHNQNVADAIHTSDIFNIMLNSGSEPLPYEPYIENTEVDVTIPALPAQSSSNSLSFGTTIQPSSVAVDVAEVVSCGDKVTDSQSVNYGKYKIPVTLTAGSAETTDIYLDEPLRKVGDEAEYVDYATHKWHRVTKNLLQNTTTSQTIKGVTFTVNANGSVTCNGTNHGNNPIIFELNNPDVVFPEGVYITSGCPAGGSITGGYKIQYFNGSSWNYELGSGSTFTLSGNLKYRSRILISKDVTVTNLTFYPMLRLASIEDDTYEPYIEDTELDVTLPALPTLSGTNTLTVGTEVQPSGVEIKGRIKAAGGD